jgi:hypothetical protein
MIAEEGNRGEWKEKKVEIRDREAPGELEVEPESDGARQSLLGRRRSRLSSSRVVKVKSSRKRRRIGRIVV